MNFARRDFLNATAALGAACAIGGCEKLISKATERFGQTVPDSVDPPNSPDVDPAHHLLSRAAYGPWPGDVEKVRSLGLAEWVEEQLSPDSIDDTLCDLRAGQFEELEIPAGACYEFDKRLIRQDIARHSLLRAIYSKRQLLEVMVAFWTDHLNINIEKGDCIYLKPTDDREVIRPNALGKFKDLIRASATSPAMLVYLDGNQNRRGNPNENYGRELMELHTLGVHGGYTQADVKEAARALTGWHVGTGFHRGVAQFDAKAHDDFEKTLLGQVVPAGGGEADVDRIVEIVCAHPATAQHMATKLCRRFVSDDPPTSLVNRVAEVFRNTDGDIKAMFRTILISDEFRSSAGQKFKSPFRFIVSALRAIGADTHAHPPLIEYLVRMGQGVFEYPTPDGYPDRTAPWLGTLLWRWNFAFALAGGKVPSVSVPTEKLIHAVRANGNDAEVELLFRYFVGRNPLQDERQAMTAGGLGSTSERIGLLLASPQFQWH